MNKETQKNNSKYRLELIQKATKEELIFKKYLEDQGISFNFQRGFLKPFHRIVDFYIKKYRLIIEIDGGYHTNDTTKHKDTVKDNLWGRFRTLRITNEEVNNGTYIDIFTKYIELPTK